MNQTAYYILSLSIMFLGIFIIASNQVNITELSKLEEDPSNEDKKKFKCYDHSLATILNINLMIGIILFMFPLLSIFCYTVSKCESRGINYKYVVFVVAIGLLVTNSITINRINRSDCKLSRTLPILSLVFTIIVILGLASVPAYNVYKNSQM